MTGKRCNPRARADPACDRPPQVRTRGLPMRPAMVLQAACACPRCGRSTSETALFCGLCGQLLRHELRRSAVVATAATTSGMTPSIAPEIAPRPAAASAEFTSTIAVRKSASPRDEARARLEPWFYFGSGIVTATFVALMSMLSGLHWLSFMGWFLESLVHEMGHAAVAWLFGMPAIPAISLEGHAAAVHSQQQVLLVLMVSAGLATAAWRCLAGPAKWTGLVLALVVHPLLAFTGGKDLLHLLAGHGAELVFATLCLWKALDGGFTSSRLERALYSSVGWFLVGKNAWLCFGLVSSAGARATYHENGSFGFTNDYLRVANEVLDWRLETVAGFMLMAALAVVPAAIVLWRLVNTRFADETVLSDG